MAVVVIVVEMATGVPGRRCARLVVQRGAQEWHRRADGGPGEDTGGIRDEAFRHEGFERAHRHQAAGERGKRRRGDREAASDASTEQVPQPAPPVVASVPLICFVSTRLVVIGRRRAEQAMDHRELDDRDGRDVDRYVRVALDRARLDRAAEPRGENAQAAGTRYYHHRKVPDIAKAETRRKDRSDRVTDAEPLDKRPAGRQPESRREDEDIHHQRQGRGADAGRRDAQERHGLGAGRKCAVRKLT